MLTTALLVLIAVHILAALRHHFFLHNDTLRRMLPVRRRSG
jgi:cytochrome b561